MNIISKLQLGTSYFRHVSIGLVVFFVISSTFFISTALRYNRRSLLAGVRSSLHGILNTTTEGLKIWMADQKYFIHQLAKDRYLVEAVQRLLAEQAVPEPLSASRELARIRNFLAAYQDNKKKNGFIIINSDLINIASMRDADLGIPNLIAKARPDLIRRVFLGKTVFIPPFRSDVHPQQSAATSPLPPSVFFAAPVIDQADKIIAAIIVCLDPTKSFSRIIQLSRLSESGET
ncbi:MAG: hypothetical protein D3922_13505, partial [Candidatus Electrothrix sp. AR1]|nr:hypothetical protein [Candidatus Electrothrix sp. AR1]